MKKIVNGKIVDTEKMTEIAGETIAYSYSNNPIGWGNLLLDGADYWYMISGGNDIFAPDDSLEKIGTYTALTRWITGDWRYNNDLINHLDQL